MMDKSTKSVIPSFEHHRQNPMDATADEVFSNDTFTSGESIQGQFLEICVSFLTSLMFFQNRRQIV
jgi:hypothetical protein